MKNFSDYVSSYKKQLDKGDVQIAYNGLVKYVMKLKSVFSKKMGHKYSFGSIFHGYLDYTYFYFSSDYLKSRKLKFGLVLNHQEMRFEIWLLGQTITIQKKYWSLLKTTKWNKGKTEMPQYSVIEGVLVMSPNFDDLDLLAQEIEDNLIQISDEIINLLKTIP